MKNLTVSFAAFLLASFLFSPLANSETSSKSSEGLSITEAIANPNRLSRDTKDDALRMPAAVLEFINAPVGGVIADIEAGRGYYTELLASIVGPTGSVTMVNPPFFDTFISEEDIATRLGENGKRLANVTFTKTTFDQLPMDDSSVDMVTWVLGPHELYFTPRPGVSFGDVDKTYAEIFRVLKPGGIFIPLDHAAKSGAPSTTGGETHRIDPSIVRQEAEKAGLIFESSSDVLANADDDYALSVFDPKVRRKTDRFIHRYRKPQ